MGTCPLLPGTKEQINQISSPSKPGIMKGENIIWQGKSSQLVNLPVYLLGSVVVLFCIDLSGNWLAWGNLAAMSAAAWMGWKYLEVRSARYILTNRRIIRQAGVLNRQTYDIELCRVCDVLLSEPLLYRIVGLGNIRVISGQISSEVFHLRAIRQPMKIREQIRGIAESPYDLYAPLQSGSHTKYLELPN